MTLEKLTPEGTNMCTLRGISEPSQTSAQAQGGCNPELSTTRTTGFSSKGMAHLQRSFPFNDSFKDQFHLAFRIIPQNLLQSPGSLLAHNLNIRWSRPDVRGVPVAELGDKPKYRNIFSLTGTTFSIA